VARRLADSVIKEKGFDGAAEWNVALEIKNGCLEAVVVTLREISNSEFVLRTAGGRN
jgi:hypothetical protein